MYLNGVTSNYSDWTTWSGPDVLFGGGAEQWIAGSGSPGKKDYYEVFKQAGYQVVSDKDQLAAADASQRTLGVFSQSNMAKVSRGAAAGSTSIQGKTLTCGVRAVDRP
jgi:alkaline phosphatase